MTRGSAAPRFQGSPGAVPTRWQTKISNRNIVYSDDLPVDIPAYMDSSPWYLCGIPATRLDNQETDYSTDCIVAYKGCSIALAQNQGENRSTRMPQSMHLNYTLLVGLVLYNYSKYEISCKTDQRRRVQTVTGADLGEADLMQQFAAICSSDPSQFKDTAHAGPRSFSQLWREVSRSRRQVSCFT